MAFYRFEKVILMLIISFDGKTASFDNRVKETMGFTLSIGLL